jgi:hypothetical protein
MLRNVASTCYVTRMRTTLTVDDRIAKALKALAHRTGKPFRQVVNETLQAGLAARSAPKRKPYRIKAISSTLIPGFRALQHPGCDAAASPASGNSS